MCIRCECEFDTATTFEFGNRRAIHSDSEPQPQPSWPPRLGFGVIDGLAQRLFLRFLQSRSRRAIKTGRIFSVRPEHVAEEGRRHLVMLRIGHFRVFGDRARRHFPRKVGIACCIAGGEPRRGARTELMDRGADYKIRQRHPLGEADNPGSQAHPGSP
jgi:hypothetical protein